MTTWNDVVQAVHEYQHQDMSDRLIKLLTFIGDRTQILFVARTGNNSGRDWVEISSPIGRLSRQQIEHVAQRLSQHVVGGLVIEDGMAVVSTSLPVRSLHLDDLSELIEFIALTADRFEAEILGRDDL